MKQFIKLILSLIGTVGLLKYIFLGIFAGLFHFIFINLITKVVGHITLGDLPDVSIEYSIVFASIILFIIWTRRLFSLSIINLSQTIFWKLRKEILAMILKANYQQLSNKKTRIKGSVLGDVYILTDASISIISFSTSIILSISSFIYLATISGVLFFITLFVALAGMFVYSAGSKRNRRSFQRAREIEDKFIINLDTILNGFKEIFMEPRKGKFIYDTKISGIAYEAYKNNSYAHVSYLNNQIIGQVLFYILVASILLIFRVKLGIRPADSVSFVFALLYLLGSIQTIMVLLPGMIRAGVSCGYLLELKNELQKANYLNPFPEKYISKDEFSKITIRDLQFSYETTNFSFAIGPINMTVKKGDVIFIYGGNGSGKTTLIYSILGLTHPMSGDILLNECVITAETYPTYRTLFSVVFSDFYLFNELYSLNDVDIDKWHYYVRLFEMEDKVKLIGKTFSTTDLSTGQRKRLALITALLEEKPVLVLDEWAADQDPHFRKKFYTDIIPLLRHAGFTIIAITHDDKYFYCADRLYKMDFGQLVEDKVYLHSERLIS